MSKHTPFKPPSVNQFKQPTECQSCGSDELVLIHTVTRPVEVYWTEDFYIIGDTTIASPMNAWHGDIPAGDEIEEVIQCRKCKATFGLEGWYVFVASSNQALNSRVIRGAKRHPKSLDI